MSLNQLTETSQPDLARDRPCVVVAADSINQNLRVCLESTFAHTSTDVPVVVVSAEPLGALRHLLGEGTDRQHGVWFAPAVTEPLGESTDTLTAAVDRALPMLWPADIALLSEPCRVAPGWLERLRGAARADSNTATASALTDVGTALALSDADRPVGDLSTLANSVAEHTMALRPRLSLAVGPCVYLRREALELVGPLDRELKLRWALEVDFAQRCVLSGLAHVAADDVVVGALTPASATTDLPAGLRERYPHLSQPDVTSASGALPRALEAARRPRARLCVTIDARALSAAITGTQRHILELIKALAATGQLRLRLVVSSDTSADNVDLLRSLPHTELLPMDSIDEATPRSTVFHRPQQVFGPPDLRLALRLGERIVLNQLDLIAYRNPAYHANPIAWHSHRRVSRQALTAADRVIVFSDHTRMELLSDELADLERIRIVPPGLDQPSPDHDRRPAELDWAPHAASHDGQNPTEFLLCLGTDFRHKNRVFALRLLASLRELRDWKGRLVFAGTHIPNGSSQELERSFLDDHPELLEAVIELGAIDEAEKTWMMRRAAAVVYPSVYEGFGLVPFEAALSGVPCLFAPQSSLAEVLPAAAATIVRWNPDESADRAYALLVDPVARARHVQALVEAASRLTWSDAAEATVEVYSEAAVAPFREASRLSRDEVAREHELRELIAAHDALVARLVHEREHAQRVYDELNAEVGFGLSLIGPHGALPEDVQRALLALSARPALSRALYGAAGRVFRSARAMSRSVKGAPRRTT